MKITESQIRRAVPGVYGARLAEFVRVFNEWAPQFGVDTPARVVHFLAQVMHESGALRYTEELASGDAYEGRRSLGNTRKGDGRRYKGRGLIQLTGRANYQQYQDSGFSTGDIMSHPELLAKSPGCTKSALWFWWMRKLSDIADLDDGGLMGEQLVERITRRVNGGLNGIAQRKLYYRKLKREFGLIAVALVMMLTGCRSVSYVPVERVSTELKVKTDTLLERDSIFRHDSVWVATRGDTVFLERWHTVYRDRWRERILTDTLIWRDSIPVPYPVEVEARRSLSQRLHPWLAGWGLGLLTAFSLLIYLRRKA